MNMLAFAKEIAGRIEKEASGSGVPVAVCVVDIHGNVILKYCMNGSSTLSAELSERKAYTAALMRMRTADIFHLVQPGQPLFPMMMSGGRYCAIGGGAPVSHVGRVVAGVGVCGGTVEQDVAILEAVLKRESQFPVKGATGRKWRPERRSFREI